MLTLQSPNESPVLEYVYQAQKERLYAITDEITDIHLLMEVGSNLNSFVDKLFM